MNSKTLKAEWDKLDDGHKKFVLRVRDSGGCKHGAEPCSTYPEDIDEPSVGFWNECEKLNFIECTGSYKWVVTSKYIELEKELFGINIAKGG